MAQFDWGTSTRYGNYTPAESVGRGNAAVPVRAQITGLAPGTVDQVRIRVTYSAATHSHSPTPQSTPSASANLHDVTWSGPVNLDTYTVAAGTTAILDPTADTTVTLTGNLVVEGTLVSRPDPGVLHVIRFANVDEARFVGGGMDPVASDVGLWVVGAGKLDLLGQAKTDWTRTAGSLAAGAARLTVQDASGWRVGDEISIAPTGLGDYDGFDASVITAVDGNTVTLATPTRRAHPAVTANGRTYLPEVFNLTRTVRIEGTGPGDALGPGGHRAHAFIHKFVYDRPLAA